MAAELEQVPLVPMARVTHVYVLPGDYVHQGQLLAELDTRLAELQIAATRAAIESAKVTLERTRIGSPSVMPKERPEIDEVALKIAQQEQTLAKQLVDVYQNLSDQGAQALDALLTAKRTLATADGAVETAQLDLKMSRPGRPLSIRAAELAVQEAELSLQRQLQELQDYKIYAIGDGIVDQVMIHEGEYKAGAGTPAFTLAVGRWFGAYLDQMAIGRFEEGTRVEVRLEAFPGRIFQGRVEKIIPIVTYSQGGPEASHPIRPLGTGSPEWPATFTARIALEGDLRHVIPGLTGFANVHISHQATAVPRAEPHVGLGQQGDCLCRRGRHVPHPGGGYGAGIRRLDRDPVRLDTRHGDHRRRARGAAARRSHRRHHAGGRASLGDSHGGLRRRTDRGETRHQSLIGRESFS